MPLSAGLLTSYAKSIPQIREGYDVMIEILRQDPEVTVCSYQQPDVLAFSVYSWNFRQSTEVARLGKLSSPGSLTVFGGPMIPNDSDDLKAFFNRYPFIDIVVHGMGEWVFSEILLARLRGEGFGSIAGISYRNGSGFISTGEPLYLRNLDELPSPFLDGTFDELISRYKDRITGVLWETNRGCPYNCVFCVQGNSAFSKIIKFSQDRLSKELEWISERKISYLFGTDANFGILPRDIEITKKIAGLHRQNGYPEVFFINWLKNSSKKMLEIIEILQEVNVQTRLTLSMQSFNERTLTAIKRKNMTTSTFQKLREEAAKKGITTYTELILGLPNDTYESVISNLARCMDRYLTHFFVVYLCRLLDGTEMAQYEYRDKYKLQTRSCRVGFGRQEGYDIGVEEKEEIIVATSTLPVKDWSKAFIFIYAALVLYNFRLAFFILNYLKRELAFNIINFMEYIIQEPWKDDSYAVIKKAIGIIDNGRQSILDSKTNLVSLDFTGHMLFECQEAALFILLREIDSFYKELRMLVDKYLDSKKIAFDAKILSEVFRYQRYCIPTWRGPNHYNASFEFNIPQYFQALCVDDNPIAICRQKTYAEIGDEADENRSPVDFAKSRLTISTFKISKVKSIRSGEDEIRN